MVRYMTKRSLGESREDDEALKAEKPEVTKAQPAEAAAAADKESQLNRDLAMLERRTETAPAGPVKAGTKPAWGPFSETPAKVQSLELNLTEPERRQLNGFTGDQLLGFVGKYNDFSKADYDDLSMGEDSPMDNPAVYTTLKNNETNVIESLQEQRHIRQLGVKREHAGVKARQYVAMRSSKQDAVNRLKAELAKTDPASSVAAKLRADIRVMETELKDLTANEDAYEKDIITYKATFDRTCRELRKAHPNMDEQTLRQLATNVADLEIRGNSRKREFERKSKQGELVKLKAALEKATPGSKAAFMLNKKIKALEAYLNDYKSNVYRDSSQELYDAQDMERLAPIKEEYSRQLDKLAEEDSRLFASEVKRLVAAGYPQDRAEDAAHKAVVDFHGKRLIELKREYARKDIISYRKSQGLYGDGAELESLADSIMGELYNPDMTLNVEKALEVSRKYGLTTVQSAQYRKAMDEEARNWLGTNGSAEAMTEADRMRLVAEHYLGGSKVSKMSGGDVAKWYASRKDYADSIWGVRTEGDQQTEVVSGMNRKFSLLDAWSRQLMAATKRVTGTPASVRNDVEGGTVMKDLVSLRLYSEAELKEMTDNEWAEIAASDNTGIFANGVTDEAKAMFMQRNRLVYGSLSPVGDVRVDGKVDRDTMFNGPAAIFLKLYQAGVRPSGGTIDLRNLDMASLAGKLAPDDLATLQDTIALLYKDSERRYSNLVALAEKSYGEALSSYGIEQVGTREAYMYAFLSRHLADFDPSAQFVAFCNGADYAESNWKGGLNAPEDSSVPTIDRKVLEDYDDAYRKATDAGGLPDYYSLGRVFSYNVLDGKYDTDAWEYAGGADGEVYARRRPRVSAYTAAKSGDMLTPGWVGVGNAGQNFISGFTFGFYRPSVYKGESVADTRLYRLTENGWVPVSSNGGTTRYVNEGWSENEPKWTSYILGANNNEYANSSRRVLGEDGRLDTVDNRFLFAGNLASSILASKGLGAASKGLGVPALKTGAAYAYPKLARYINICNKMYYANIYANLGNLVIQQGAAKAGAQNNPFFRGLNTAVQGFNLIDNTINPLSLVKNPYYNAAYKPIVDALNGAKVGTNVTAPVKDGSTLDALNPLNTVKQQYNEVANGVVNTFATPVKRAVTEAVMGPGALDAPEMVLTTDRDIAARDKAVASFAEFKKAYEDNGLDGDVDEAYFMNISGAKSIPQAVGLEPIGQTPEGKPVYVNPVQHKKHLDTMLRSNARITPIMVNNLPLELKQQCFQTFVKANTGQHGNLLTLYANKEEYIRGILGNDVRFNNFKVLANNIFCSIREKGNEEQFNRFLNTLDPDKKIITPAMRTLLRQLPQNGDQLSDILWKCGIGKVDANTARSIYSELQHARSSETANKVVTDLKGEFLGTVLKTPSMWPAAMGFVVNYGVEWFREHPVMGFGCLAMLLVGLAGIGELLFGGDEDDEDRGVRRPRGRRAYRDEPDEYGDMAYENAYVR